MNRSRALSSLPARLVTALPLTLLAWAGLGLDRTMAAETVNTPGGKGAQVYCFMRGAGNSHDVSWIAAYALIKRQSASMFKTSPEHAAVMITEAVVQNPGSFPDCGRYLGSLYEKAAAREAAAAAPADKSQADGTTPSDSGAASGPSPARGTSRYAY
jgi:hypothetical protein